MVQARRLWPPVSSARTADSPATTFATGALPTGKYTERRRSRLYDESWPEAEPTQRISETGSNASAGIGRGIGWRLLSWVIGVVTMYCDDIPFQVDVEGIRQMASIGTNTALGSLYSQHIYNFPDLLQIRLLYAKALLEHGGDRIE